MKPDYRALLTDREAHGINPIEVAANMLEIKDKLLDALKAELLKYINPKYKDVSNG